MKKSTFLRELVGWLLILAAVTGFRTAVADWNRIPSSSMEPTLFPGDLVWVDKTAYGASIPLLNWRLIEWGQPERGDIITFVPPHTEDLLVKRVVGLPGDQVRVRGRLLWINGELQPMEASRSTTDADFAQEQLDAVNHLIRFNPGPATVQDSLNVTVPEGHYFVLGDFRDNSYDSRYWGFVDGHQIMGRVTHIALSVADQRPLHERFAFRLN